MFFACRGFIKLLLASVAGVFVVYGGLTGNWGLYLLSWICFFGATNMEMRDRYLWSQDK